MYIYEMHQHSSICSACSKLDVKDLITIMKKRGFAGVVLTNHFYHGNTRVNRNQPWEDFVGEFEREYLLAKEEGEKQGIQVFFGIEQGLGDGKEVLIYGVEPKVIADHPEIRDLCFEPLLKCLYEVVNEAGGLVIQAHPYRVRDYIKEPHKDLNKDYLDGYEIYNACNTPEDNQNIEKLKEEKDKIFTAGSDSHWDNEIRFGIKTEEPIKDNKDLVRVLKEGKFQFYIEE